MGILKRLMEMSLLCGVWNALIWGVRRVRIHPLARIEGNNSGLEIGCNTKIGPGSRFLLGRGAGIVIGRGCWIYRDIELHTKGKIFIGDGSTLQKGVTLNGNVNIGAGCIIAPNVFASSGTHVYDKWPELPIREQERRLFYTSKTDESIIETQNYDHPIEIGEDCWLGINVVVMRGVVVGRGCIVGANAVLTKSVEPYSIVAGVPAKPIGSRLLWAPPASLDATHPDAVPYLYEGFVISTYNGKVTAKFNKDVKIALELSKSTTLEMVVESSGKGVISCGRNDAEFSKGENCLRLGVPGESVGNEATPRLIRLSIKPALPEGSLRLLSCRLMK